MVGEQHETARHITIQCHSLFAQVGNGHLIVHFHTGKSLAAGVKTPRFMRLDHEKHGPRAPLQHGTRRAADTACAKLSKSLLFLRPPLLFCPPRPAKTEGTARFDTCVTHFPPFAAGLRRFQLPAEQQEADDAAALHALLQQGQQELQEKSRNGQQQPVGQRTGQGVRREQPGQRVEDEGDVHDVGSQRVAAHPLEHGGHAPPQEQAVGEPHDEEAAAEARGVTVDFHQEPAGGRLRFGQQVLPRDAGRQINRAGAVPPDEQQPEKNA